MDAVVEVGDVYDIDLERCIGCGLCVPSCPADACSLVPKAEPAPLPKNVFEQQKQIAQERGLR
jgi:formate hydrogenlyase subunit 6/NADH:ubiquinone oxidoreductase subunit I